MKEKITEIVEKYIYYGGSATNPDIRIIKQNMVDAILDIIESSIE